MAVGKRAEIQLLFCALLVGACASRASADEPPATLGDIFRKAQGQAASGNQGRTDTAEVNSDGGPSDKKNPPSATPGGLQVERDPHKADYAMRGFVKRVAGDERGAIDEFTKAIELNPYGVYSLRERGNAHLELNEFNDALADFGAALALDADDTDALYGRGRAYAALWRYDPAMADADYLISRRPNDLHGHWLRGDIQKQWRRFDAALADYRRAADLEPDSCYAHFVLAETLAAIGRAEDAVAHFSRAIELDPSKSGPYFQRALARGGLGDWPAIVDDLNEFLRMEPESIEGLLQRAAAHGLLGNTLPADDDYQAALKLAGEGHLAKWEPRLFTSAAQPAGGSNAAEPGRTEPAVDEPDAENLLAAFTAARFDQGLIVPVRIGERTLRFLVDTGCSATCLDRSLVSLLGPERKKVAIVTGGSSIQAPLHDPIPLSIGELPPIAPAGPMGCWDLSTVSSLASMHLDGILGLDVLSQLVLRVDLAGHRFDLLRSAGDDAGVAIPFCPGSGRKLDPTDPLGCWRCPRVVVTLPDGKTVETLLDTGMLDTSLSLNAETFDSLRRGENLLPLRNSLAGSLADARMFRCGVLTSCMLGEFRHENLIVDESTSGAIMGLEYLTRYVATFDFPNHRLLLKPSPLFAASTAELALRSGQMWCGEVANWLETDIEESLDDLVRDDQTRAFGLRSRAAFHLSRKRFDRAIADYSAAIALRPRDASLYHYRGQARQRAGKYRLAIADYTQAIELAPRWDLPVYYRAVTRLLLGEYRRAIPDFDTAIRLDSTWAAAFNDRGAAWAGLGNIARAQQDFQHALQLDPDDAAAAKNLKAVLAYKTQAHRAAGNCRGRQRHGMRARWRARRTARIGRWH